MIGKQVGNYRILLKIGDDNLGVIYQAQHVAGGYPVTMRHFAQQYLDVQGVARYLEIAQRATSLNHAGIWQVRESVWSGRNAMIAGEALVTGETLDVILSREGRLWPELVVKLGWQLASALGAAHSSGIFHCRLDGDSIYCFPDQSSPGGYRTKIMDFGVAAFLDPGPPDWRNPRVEAFGLPYYMAPEQCHGGLVDYRSDVYSLGCLLFHMATGRPPFEGATHAELASAHQNAQTPGPTAFEQSIPYELDAMILQMLAKEPARRPGMPQVAYELERIAKHYWTTPTVERTVELDLKIGSAPPPMMGVVPTRAMEPAKRSLAIPIAAILVALAAAGGTVAALKPWKKKAVAAPTEPTTEPTPEPTPPPKAVETPTAPKPTTPTPTPPAPKAAPTEADKQLELARTALNEERFPDAVTAIKAALKLDPKNPTAAALMKQAKAEPGNKKTYDEFVKAAEANDPAKTTKLLAKITPDSVYRPKAQKTYDRVKRDYLHVKKAEAKALAETRMCERIAPIEKQVRGYFPDGADEIAGIEKACKPR